MLVMFLLVAPCLMVGTSSILSLRLFSCLVGSNNWATEGALQGNSRQTHREFGPSRQAPTFPWDCKQLVGLAVETCHCLCLGSTYSLTLKLLLLRTQPVPTRPAGIHIHRANLPQSSHTLSPFNCSLLNRRLCRCVRHLRWHQRPSPQCFFVRLHFST